VGFRGAERAIVLNNKPIVIVIVNATAMATIAIGAVPVPG
jgi:hypothetical protein